MKPLRESEIRQRKMLSERLANRKSSLPSADSDLMAANDDISYGRLREQENFDQDLQPTNATCKNCEKLKDQIEELKKEIKWLEEGMWAVEGKP